MEPHTVLRCFPGGYYSDRHCPLPHPLRCGFAVKDTVLLFAVDFEQQRTNIWHKR